MVTERGMEEKEAEIKMRVEGTKITPPEQQRERHENIPTLTIVLLQAIIQ